MSHPFGQVKSVDAHQAVMPDCDVLKTRLRRIYVTGLLFQRQQAQLLAVASF